MLRHRARLLLQLLGTGVAASAVLLGSPRRAGVGRERLPAFAQHGISQPRAAAVSDLQRLAQPDIELEKNVMPTQAFEPALGRAMIARQLERADLAETVTATRSIGSSVAMNWAPARSTARPSTRRM
jgi:hypothetical protein